MNKKCERCYTITARLYPYPYTDEDTGEEKTMNVCWDCDFELINGRGDLFQDAREIWQDREEENL